MEENEFEILLKKINSLLKQTTDKNRFDEMEDALRALNRWNDRGRTGKMPFIEKLRVWNLLAEEPVQSKATTEPHPGSEEIEAILEQLKAWLTDPELVDNPESDDYRAARKELRQWKEAGGVGEMPHTDRLAAWGLWPPRQEDGSVMGEEKSKAEETSIPAETPPKPEVHWDDKVYKLYEDALADHSAGSWLAAIEKLKTVLDGAPSEERGKIQALLEDAHRKLELGTNALIKKAREAESMFPENLEKQRSAWQAVASYNPDSPEAKHALATLTKQQEQRQLELDLGEWLKAARKAAGGLDLPELSTLLGKVEIWLHQGEAGELDDNLAKRTRQAYEAIVKLRADTRSALGIASTKVVEQDYKGAYTLAKGYLFRDKPVPVMIDEAGIAGPAGAEVSTKEFFEYITKTYISATKKRKGRWFLLPIWHPALCKRRWAG